MKDTKYYTLKCKHLYVATDHKPLLGIFGDKSLVDIDNKRLARWKFDKLYNPGKSQIAADTLSRNKPLYSLYISTVVDDESDEQDLLEASLDWTRWGSPWCVPM